MTTVELIRGLGVGGAEALLVSRLRHEQDRARRTVVVNTYPEQNHHAAGLREIGVDMQEPGGGPLLVAMAIAKQFLRAPAGTVFVSHSPSVGVVLKGCKALRLGRGKSVVDVVHNSSYRWFYGVLGRVLNRFADTAILVGNEVASSPTAAAYRRTVMVHGGVDRDRFLAWKEHSSGVRCELETLLGGDVDTIGITVGGLTAVKHQALGIEATALMGPRHGLLVFGTGPEEERLRSLASRLGVKVYFAGQVPEAWRFIAWSDVLVHTSRYEGLPVVLMEAAALGVPIVATPFEGAQEVASTGAQVAIAASWSPESVAEAWRRARGAAASGVQASAAYWAVDRFCEEFYAVVDRPPTDEEQTRASE